MGQWLGDLFYRGVTPSEIEGMTFSRMSFWASWDNTMRRQEKASKTVYFRSYADAFRKRRRHA